jgi:hypothetical protein
MGVFQRGKVWWFKFYFAGREIKATPVLPRCDRGAASAVVLAESGFSPHGDVFLGDHPKAAIDDRVKSGHREKA